MSRTGNAFNAHLDFETQGIEIKGYHSLLGDPAMPDFQMSPIDLTATASLAVRGVSGNPAAFFPTCADLRRMLLINTA